MTKPFSVPYKQKIVEQLVGRDAKSARQVSRETGISQETVSRWLREARTLPLMAKKRASNAKSIDEKIRILSEASKLSGEELRIFLEREGVLLAQLQQWRVLLEDEENASTATRKRMRKLERELARKEKALAEAAALLVLKKKLESLSDDENDDTDEENET